MTNDPERLSRLLQKLDAVAQQQERLQNELRALQQQVSAFAASQRDATAPVVEPIVELPEKTVPVAMEEVRAVPPEVRVNQPPGTRSDWEKFIGENLINKIGIAITVIGVAIGAKYAIDHDLISPLTRIVLGYGMGLGLLGFALRLKKNYENFSAVLLSGSMAILYFITFAAYSFYDLFPQVMAFGLMVVFTGFTVVAAIHYNRSVIAHIGLVGAYAVPFLLSEGSGKMHILFSYMAIINAGILIIAFKKYWKSLYYSAFGLTWLIYYAWYISSYDSYRHYTLALIFVSVFFAIFYLTFLAYKLLQHEKFEALDVIMLLSNAFIFYSLGYDLLSRDDIGEQLLGVFTLLNAVVHFGVCVVIYRRQLADRNLFYLVSGLVLIFVTIAVPVQLDGNWVTLLWAGEAALLFWIGRSRKVFVYESLSYPLMVLAFGSIIHDWSNAYNVYMPEAPETRVALLLNIHFLSAMLFATAFGFMVWVNRHPDYPVQQPGLVNRIATVAIPAILLITLFNAVRLEIATYWDQLYTDSSLSIPSDEPEYPNYYSNYALPSFKIIWIVNYFMLFVALLAVVDLRKIKNTMLGLVSQGLLVLSLCAFLFESLYCFSELRDLYLQQDLAIYYPRGFFYIGIRYVSFAFAALPLLCLYLYHKQAIAQQPFPIPFDIAFHVTLLWMASSELIHWMDMAGSSQSYKLGLSILWGVYSLLLIVLGIWKKKKILRVGAIILFGITLAKLFLYDIADLDTIAKTVVFVALGILLLIISFLYNKYKHVISDETEA